MVPADVTWSVDPTRVHDGEVDVGVCLCQLLRHHHLLPLEGTHTDTDTHTQTSMGLRK